MRIFVYEFITGGGWRSCTEDPPPDSLLSEGRAMLTALAADFAALEDTAVDVLYDTRLPKFQGDGITTHGVPRGAAELGMLEELAATADWTVLIAPEFDGHLLARTRVVERVGGRLLSPSSQVVSLASDKQATAECLARHDIPVPRGIALAAGEPFPPLFSFPAVLKPRDGAGSLGVELVSAGGELESARNTAARLEVFCPGTPASVACLCGPDAIVPLEPCLQELAGRGDFTYRGGSVPIQADLAARARRLALRVAAALPEPFGFVGIDLVLGSDPAGSGDVVIEVNPRLTTSYVGLRALSHVNLAGAMIAVAQGRDAGLCWKSNPIHFSPSGICG